MRSRWCRDDDLAFAIRVRIAIAVNVVFSLRIGRM
jgi:hypothetical protein